MENKIIVLRYRKIINADSNSTWERLVHQDTYQEFKMQSQLYNQEQRYNSFSEMLRNVPGAEKLHFLVSAAATNYVAQLKNVIPDITNNLGLRFLEFSHFKFEIINSDLKNIDKHVVAINFYSEELNYIAQVGSYLLTSKVAQPTENNIQLTDMFTISPYLTIHSISL